MADDTDGRDFLGRRQALQLGAAAALAGAPALAQPAGPRGGVLRIASSITGTEPLDPLAVSSARTMSFILWDRLAWVGPDQKVQPELAVSWQASRDLRVWTFELRQGVTFHNGKKFTAADVVATFARVLDPAKGGQAFTSLSPYLEPDRVKANGEHSVVFSLKEPLFNLDALLAGDQLVIMPAGVSDEEIRATGIGTGPFMFKEYVPSSHLFVVRNPNYWRTGYPLLDGIELYKVIDATQRASGLLSGQFDLVTELTPLAKRQLGNRPNLQVTSIPSGNVYPLFMLGNAKPFDDNRVRLAFKKGIDRNRINQQVFLGEAVIANDQPIPPGAPLSANLPPIARDVEGAKKLLAEAGYPNGLDIVMHSTSWVLDMAVAAADSLKDAGIRITVQNEPTPTFIPNYNKGIWPLFNSQYGMRADALLIDIFYAPTSQKGNLSRYLWQNDAFAAAYRAGQAEPDATKRLAYFAEVQRILRDEGNLVIPSFSNVIEAFSRKVLNYAPHPIGYWRQYWGVALAK